jgi:threonine-phosphate decarboxylase
MLQGHGDDGYLHDKPIQADFSTNVYYGGAPAGLREHLYEQWDKVTRYPEVIAESLAEKIAGHYNLSNDHVLVTNGSTESIYLIAQAFKQKKSAIVIPAFAEYEDACRIHGHQIQFISWEDFPAGIAEAELVFICNPNNPSGQIITELEEVITQNEKTLFVVDEAFIEFTVALTSLIALVHKYDNLIVMRSMTKAYAIPGLRLGYIIAAPALIRLLNAEKQPWTVNAMALEAGHFIFDRLEDLVLPIDKILADKADFISGLATAPLKIYHSHTHFFLAEIQVENAALLKRFLLDKFNILIRDAGNFRGLSENHIRIATLSPDKNQLLIKAFSEWKHQ